MKKEQFIAAIACYMRFEIIQEKTNEMDFDTKK